MVKPRQKTLWWTAVGCWLVAFSMTIHLAAGISGHATARHLTFDLAVVALAVSIGAASSIGWMLCRWLVPLAAAWNMGHREALREQAAEGRHLRAVADE